MTAQRFSFPFERSILAALAAIALGCGPAPRAAKPGSPSAESATFVKAAPRVGRVAIEDHRVEFHLESEARAPGRLPLRVRTESVDRERRREEVLAVFDRIVTKKKITYEKIEHAETRNGARVAAADSPLAGHAYIAEVKESVPVFTDAFGGPVSDAEQRELARRLAGLGKPDPFLEGIPDGLVRPGGPAPGMAGGFLELFEASDESSPEGPDIGKVDVRYAGIREEPQGRCGVFAFTIDVQMAGEPRLALDLNGEFLVRLADSAPVRLEARGPAKLTGVQTVEGVNVQLSGTGDMTGSLRVTYY
jgi:hypothetical protein